MHISFDLETLGNTANAPIVQIGAVKFDNNGNIISSFLSTIDLEDLEQYNLPTNFSTVNWWLQQTPEAIENVFGKQTEKTTLKKALTDFRAYLTAEECTIWSHASFDPPILKNNLIAVGLPPIKNYRAFTDLRTLMLIAGSPTIEKQGIAHTALDDALHQYKQIKACFQILKFE